MSHQCQLTAKDKGRSKYDTCGRCTALSRLPGWSASDTALTPGKTYATRRLPRTASWCSLGYLRSVVASVPIRRTASMTWWRRWDTSETSRGTRRYWPPTRLPTPADVWDRLRLESRSPSPTHRNLHHQCLQITMKHSFICSLYELITLLWQDSLGCKWPGYASKLI